MKREVVSLVAVAFGVRLAVLALAGANVRLLGDEAAYQQIAENVAAGRGFWQDNNPFFPGQQLWAWQAPLYPLALAAIYSAAGPNLLLAKLFGVIVGAATVAVVYDLALRVFSGARRPAAAAAAIVAIYPALVTNSHAILSETLFTFLVVAAFDLGARVIDPREDSSAARTAAVAGVVWGLATLTRGITLYFTPLLAIGLGLRRGLAAGVLFLIASVVVIAPYTIRNHAVFGRFVLLETKGGVNLWLGNSPYTPDRFIRNVWKAEVRAPMLAELPAGELERDHVAYRLATSYIVEHPATFFARMPIKHADFWGFERYVVDNAETTVKGGGWHSPVKAAADLATIVAYMFVMVAGVAGFVHAPDDRWKLSLGAFLVYFTSVHLVIFGDGRFHLPLIPFVAIYAGWILARPRLERSAVRTAIVAVLVACLAAGWAHEVWAALRVLRGAA